MKKIKVRITGICPIMFNSPQTVNPLNAYTKALKELTSKRQKQEEDTLEILHLKFLASCYYNERGEYFIPAMAIMKSFEAGAKENKLGTKFRQSLRVTKDAFLNFADNGLEPERLWQECSDKYVDIRPVGVMKSKVVTARMIVPEWWIETEVEYDETQLNSSDVWLAMKNAGLRHGLGTYRDIYGKFKVEEIK